MNEFHIYQTLHLNRGSIRCLESHIRVLNHTSLMLFGRNYTPDRESLRRRILTLSRELRYTPTRSSFIRLSLTPDLEEHLSDEGCSYYDGYALRSIRPSAISLSYDLPAGDLPTSARDQAAAQAVCTAQRRKADSVIRCDHADCSHTIDGHPLFGLFDGRILTPPAHFGVERAIGLEAARRAGFEVGEEEIRLRDLDRCEELFFIDHRGLTALSHCNRRPLLSFAAEHIAQMLEVSFANL